MSIDRASRIYIAGHRGMVGSAVLRHLEALRCSNLVYADREVLNLLDYKAVEAFFHAQKPDIVIIAAARVGGIQANINNQAQFLYENLTIQNNLIHQSYLNKVKKVVYLGSSCVYPRESPQPIKEEYLLTGRLEPTNEGYGLAKIAGLKMIEYYYKQYGLQGINLMPCNLYGPNDNFDPINSHVMAALVRKFVEAAERGDDEVVMWGTGNARRELLHVDDLADAIIYFLENLSTPEVRNIGPGQDISIKDLGELVARKAGFTGKLVWDISKPDGMPRKCMDVTKMRQLGFEPRIGIEEGIASMIEVFRMLKKRGETV